MIEEPESLKKRAARAKRTEEAQLQLEGISFQMGYKYWDTEVPLGDASNYVHQKFLHGQEMGRLIKG